MRGPPLHPFPINLSLGSHSVRILAVFISPRKACGPLSQAELTAAATEPLHTNTNIQSALQCLTSPSSPEIIQQAQDALLQFEQTHTDEYVTSLLALVGVESNTTLRLAAVLALKAAVSRRWKDKGRGKVGDQKIFLNEGVKVQVRRSLLNLVLTGKVDGQNHQIHFIT